MTLETLLQKSAKVQNTTSLFDAVNQAFELQQDLANGILNFDRLKPFTRVPRRENDPRIQQVEGKNIACVEVLYEVLFGQHYSTELTFTLHHDKVFCVVQTFFYPEGNRPRDSTGSIALCGQLDQVVYGQSYAELVSHAVRQAIEHRLELVTQELGIKLSTSTRETLLDAQYVSNLAI